MQFFYVQLSYLMISQVVGAEFFVHFIFYSFIELTLNFFKNKLMSLILFKNKKKQKSQKEREREYSCL